MGVVDQIDKLIERNHKLLVIKADLLAACEEACREICTFKPGRCAVCSIKPAIAKAKKEGRVKMKIILIICLVFFAGCGDLDIYVDEVDAPIGLSQPYCFGSVDEIEDYCGIQNGETNGGGY